MSSRSDQKEATRARLLEAARTVFEESSFEAANLRRIAARAGIAPGTIFVHFRDKRDLLHATLFEDLRQALEAALSGPDEASLEVWLDRLAGETLGYYARRPALSRVLLQESLLAEAPWAERFAAQMAATHAAIVARAARDPGLRPDADLPLLALSWLSFHHFALVASVQGAHPDPRGLIRRLTAQHLDGLRVP